MDSVLTQTSVALHEIKNDLTNYENAPDRQSESAYVTALNQKFQNLLQMCDRLDILVNKEPAQRRAQSRQRVNEIKYDIKHYQVSSSPTNRSDHL